MLEHPEHDIKIFKSDLRRDKAAFKLYCGGDLLRHQFTCADLQTIFRDANQTSAVGQLVTLLHVSTLPSVLSQL